MSVLTKEEVAGWIRNLIPYLEKPMMLAPEGLFNEDELIVAAGKITRYGDNLTPSYNFTVLEQTENLKALVELYKVVQ